ncbi:MAG: chromosome segregation protein SMC [Thaumarchaeota archaeon]|nr:chromosome segregation protein SMC [Candidatus Calditenuaceae archaeon]MDW8042850.1 chromosome segregation SMC family protein [Nitrososphaerota archaeon]
MVHLKRITLQGFKSFPPKRQTIELVKGLVVIAGPNGSGKSNIIDAVKFAFGELSTHALRVSRMSELINQSESGGAAQSARVTVVLDNSDRAIPLDADEVTITRRLLPTGESEYVVNNKTVGRTDLLSLLAAANLRPSGFNVVSQGAVLGIAEMGPDDLRELIEEVAGTAEFDQRKEEALKELERAERNVAVAKAGAEEVRKRLVQLEVEWFDLSRRSHVAAELEALRRREVVGELSRIDQELMRLSESIAALQERRETKVRELESIRRRLSEVEAEAFAVRREEEELVTRARALASELASARASIERLRTRMRDSGQRYAEAKRRAAAMAAAVAADAARLRSLEEEVAALESRESELSEELRRVEARLSEVAARAAALRSALAEYESRLRSVSEERVRLLREASEVDGELSALAGEEARLVAKLESLRSEIAAKADRLTKVRAELEEVQARRADVLKSLEGGKRLVEALESRAGELEARRTELMGALREAESRAFSVDGGQAARPESVKRLRALLGDRAVGVLRDLVSFPEALAPVFERALGELLDAIVVRRDSDALAVVLAASELNLRVHAISVEGRGRCDGRGGRCLACLAECASEEAKAALHVALYCAEVVEGPSFPAGRAAVTPHGAVHDGRGIFASLGGVVSESELREEMKAVAGLTARIRSLLRDVESELERVRGEAGAVREKESELRGELRSLESRESELRSQERAVAADLRRLESEASKLEAKLSGIPARFSKLRARREEIERSIRSVTAPDPPDVERDKLDGLTKEQFVLAEERSRISAELKRLRERLNSVSSELVALRSRITNTPTRLEELERVAAEQLGRVMAAAQEYAEVLRVARGKESELSRLEERLRLLRAKSVEVSEAMRSLRESADSLPQDIAAIDSELESLKLARVELASRRRALEERMREFGGQSDVQSLELPDRIAEELKSSLEQELKELELVNQLAAIQYGEVSAAYRQRSARISELESERNEILKLIEEIDSQKLKAVAETVRRVSEGFGNYFSRLTGGDGWLEFTDPQNPLESGIEMVVRFPGKAPRSARGVSGGEKTVSAVALLLSLQSLTPADFLIFDEVDAHLDAAYSANLAELLKEMSERIQIIVVSLKDIVAEKADLLIGVYGRNGASNVIAARLGEVLEGKA